MIKCCISVKELYEKFGRNLNYGYIINHTYEKETDNHYYDLVDANYNVICMDGEECKFEVEPDQRNYYRYKLTNCEGEIATVFYLTKEEMTVAVFSISFDDNRYMKINKVPD